MKIQILNTGGRYASLKVGDIVETACVHENGDVYLFNRGSRGVDDIEGAMCGEHNTHWILNSRDYKKINKTSMNIKEKFKLAFMKEPEKSFRKTGITNGDDFLTEEGVQVFLGWLLKKHGDDFKKEVVDDLQKEHEEAVR